MKKYVRIVAVALALVILCLSCASCGLFGKRLNGVYECNTVVFGVYQLYFSGKDVTFSQKNIIGKITTYEGTYSIDGDQIELIFTDDDGEEIETVLSGTWEFVESSNGNITIGAYEFEKVDTKW